MCWAEKFCFFIQLDLACILVALGSLVSALVMAAFSITYLVLGDDDPVTLQANVSHKISQLHLPISGISWTIFWSGLLIIGLLWAIFSVILIAGIRKNMPGCVLSYFAYGTVLTILSHLSALLELLHQYWILALITFLASIFYIHCLVVIHTVYDLMQRGKIFAGNGHHILDEEPILGLDNSS